MSCFSAILGVVARWIVDGSVRCRSGIDAENRIAICTGLLSAMTASIYFIWNVVVVRVEVDVG